VMIASPQPANFLVLQGDAQPFVTSLARFKSHWQSPDKKSSAACFRWTMLCLSMLGEIGIPWCPVWVGRGQNAACDRLAKQVQSVKKTKRRRKKK